MRRLLHYSSIGRYDGVCDKDYWVLIVSGWTGCALGGGWVLLMYCDPLQFILLLLDELRNNPVALFAGKRLPAPVGNIVSRAK